MRTDQNFRDDAAAAKIGEASRGLTQPVVLRRAPREAAAGEGIQRVDLGMGGPSGDRLWPLPVRWELELGPVIHRLERHILGSRDDQVIVG